MNIIAGNCILEDIETSVTTAEFLIDFADKNGINLIFKSSWKKDNRSSAEGYEGPGMEESVKIFSYIKALGVTTITDFHTPEQLSSPLDRDWETLCA